jgi:hypothetical protein
VKGRDLQGLDVQYSMCFAHLRGGVLYCEVVRTTCCAS